jgi:hypothetical protein
MSVHIWETPRWKELLKNLRESITKTATEIDKIDNPILDPVLLRSTKDFLSQRFPQMVDGNAEDFFEFVEGLARKVVPLAETHLESAKIVHKNFLDQSQIQNNESLAKNNIEFLRKIVFCFEEPVDTDTSLSDNEFRLLERLVNSFSDRLKFNPNRNDLAVREDLIVAAFRKQGLVSGSIQRVLKKIAKFAGLTTKKEKIYDMNTGKERQAIYYYFRKDFEGFLDSLYLIERGRDTEGKEVKFLSQEIPVELLYCFIQGWRAVNIEPDVLGEFLINGISNLLAYTLLMALPEGTISLSGEVQQSQALLSDEVCHDLVISLSKIVAYIIYADNWLAAIWDSPKKSKYHRSVRYVTVGNIIRIQQGAIYLNNNVMTQYVRNFTIRVGAET